MSTIISTKIIIQILSQACQTHIQILAQSSQTFFIQILSQSSQKTEIMTIMYNKIFRYYHNHF